MAAGGLDGLYQLNDLSSYTLDGPVSPSPSAGAANGGVRYSAGPRRPSRAARALGRGAERGRRARAPSEGARRSRAGRPRLDQVKNRVVAGPGGQDEVLGEVKMPPPVRGGPLGVALADQIDQPPMGAMGVVVRLDGSGRIRGRQHRFLRGPVNDRPQHGDEHHKRLVAGDLDDGGIEFPVQDDAFRDVLRLRDRLVNLLEPVQVGARTVPGREPGAFGLDDRAGIEDVAQGGPAILQDQPGIARRGALVRALDAGATVSAAADG